MDRDFDPLRASVDNLTLLVYMGKLSEVSSDVYEKWLTMTSSPSTSSTLNSPSASQLRNEITDVSYLHPGIFCQVAVEIKMATNENTISKSTSTLFVVLAGSGRYSGKRKGGIAEREENNREKEGKGRGSSA